MGDERAFPGAKGEPHEARRSVLALPPGTYVREAWVMWVFHDSWQWVVGRPFAGPSGASTGLGGTTPPVSCPGTPDEPGSLGVPAGRPTPREGVGLRVSLAIRPEPGDPHELSWPAYFIMAPFFFLLPTAAAAIGLGWRRLATGAVKRVWHG